MESIDKKRGGTMEEDSIKTKRLVQPKTAQLHVTQVPTEEISETEEHDGCMGTRLLHHKHKLRRSNRTCHRLRLTDKDLTDRWNSGGHEQFLRQE